MRVEKPNSESKDSPSNSRVAFGSAAARLVENFTPGGHPLNVIRMHYNANPNNKNIIRSIWGQGGVLAFYKGISWNIIPASVGAGFRMAVTNTADKITSTVVPNDYKTTRAIFIGLLSPAISTLILCPFGRMQTWVVTDSEKTTLRSHIAKKGFLDLWVGARIAYLRTATISVSFNVMYVNLVNHILKATSTFPSNETTMTLYLAAAAGIAAAPHALLTTPIDMIKDQMQKCDGIKEHRLYHATTSIYQRYGLWGMLRTAPLKVVRSGWYFAFTTAFMHNMGALPNYMRPPEQDKDNNHPANRM